MEWLFLLLFYALSVYLKKRQQKAAHKEIEDDPDWDPEEKPETVKGVDLLEKFLTSQGLIEQEAVTKRKAFLLEQNRKQFPKNPDRKKVQKLILSQFLKIK